MRVVGLQGADYGTDIPRALSQVVEGDEKLEASRVGRAVHVLERRGGVAINSVGVAKIESKSVDAGSSGCFNIAGPIGFRVGVGVSDLLNCVS